MGMTAPCPDSLAHAAVIGGGFSHLLFMVVSDCAAFPGEESWPLHTDTGMKSCCLFQSVFQHFSLQTFFPLRVPGDFSAWMASNTTAPCFLGIFSSSFAQGPLPARLLCRNALELWLCSWMGIRNGQEEIQI